MQKKSFPLNTNVVTQKEFASILGLTRPRIAQLIKKGKLDCYDGGVDLDGSNTIATIEYYKRKAKNDTGESAAGLDAIKTLEGLTINEITRLHKDDIAKIKLALDSQRIEQDIKKTRETLIDRDYVTRVFHRFYTIIDQELKPLGERITGEALGALHIDATKSATEAAEHTRLVNANVYKTINHIKRLFNEALERMNVEKIS